MLVHVILIGVAPLEVTRPARGILPRLLLSRLLIINGKFRMLREKLWLRRMALWWGRKDFYSEYLSLVRRSVLTWNSRRTF